jgi:glyoxylase-like metal-dependent hydrolase (beta-lactamase superfamily II)
MDIDLVILTHGHPDHIGSNVDEEGRPAFPNVRYVMQKEEWQFWTEHPDLSALNVDEHLKQILLEVAKKSLPPIQGQLKLIDRETEIVPGIQAVVTPGHTPGHIAVAISSGSEQLLCISEAAIHPIHLEQHGWYAAVDLNPEQIATTRRRLFDRASTERASVYALH